MCHTVKRNTRGVAASSHPWTIIRKRCRPFSSPENVWGLLPACQRELLYHNNSLLACMACNQSYVHGERGPRSRLHEKLLCGPTPANCTVAVSSLTTTPVLMRLTAQRPGLSGIVTLTENESLSEPVVAVTRTVYEPEVILSNLMDWPAGPAKNHSTRHSWSVKNVMLEITATYNLWCHHLLTIGKWWLQACWTLPGPQCCFPPLWEYRQWSALPT